MAGTTPERYVPFLSGGGFDTVLFLDAVEVGAAPGSVVLLDSGEMAARWPQVSTHKLSLGLLARLIESDGGTRAWLLGIQPETLEPGRGISPVVSATLESLAGLLRETPQEVLA